MKKEHNQLFVVPSSFREPTTNDWIVFFFVFFVFLVAFVTSRRPAPSVG
jgi:hypothetical protein